MKELISQLLTQAIDTLKSNGTFPRDLEPKVMVERTRDASHGDFASNLAMTLAKPLKAAPRAIAEQIVAAIPENTSIKQVTIAGPGFINFALATDANTQIIHRVLKEKEQFGQSQCHQDKSIYLEFVSANPTGPLHVGHGRGAAYGSCVGSLLKATGAKVHHEYYVNDAGRQMRILALCVWLRYLQQAKIDAAIPPNGYQGDYVINIAQDLQSTYGTQFEIDHATLQKCIPHFRHEDDPEHYLDTFIKNMEDELGAEQFNLIHEFATQQIISDIEDDLGEFGVHFDQYFKESQLYSEGLFEKGIDELKAKGHTYEKGGALWFRATTFGDDKDRVLIRENGQPTYFASDVAYHLHKYHSDSNVIIDVFGADHHGYVARLRAFLEGLGNDPDRLRVALVQFAILYRGNEKISMSTRGGQFVTLRELRDEVGNDAARYFYLMRKPEQHLDFDLELAKSQSNDNPVYYIQYAHARIASVWRSLQAHDEFDWDEQDGLAHLDQLELEQEKILLTTLARYPEVIEKSAAQLAPHMLAYYLHELANQFHTYYNACKFLIDDSHLRHARLCLVAAIQQTLANGLHLLGISAPEKM